MRVARDLRVIPKTLVLQRVGDDEEILRRDGVRAERHRTGHFRGRDAGARLEPLAVSVHEPDERHRRAADMGREQREIVDAALGVHIEDPMLAQRGQV